MLGGRREREGDRGRCVLTGKQLRNGGGSMGEGGWWQNEASLNLRNGSQV